jgi:TonB-linked SusC/RagA family outer membrane protein
MKRKNLFKWKVMIKGIPYFKTRLSHCIFLVACLLIITGSIFPQSVMAQKISGKVTDQSTGDPVVGANVQIKGTSVGTISDLEGKYEITAPSAESVLIFSYTGYTTSEIKVGTQSVIDMNLVPDAENLGEVVVIGYGTTLKKDITTAIVKVDPKNIPNAASSGINELFFGKASGIQARQYSTQPGGQVDLSIRGRGAPLVVVDGVVVPTDALESGLNYAEINNVRRGNLGNLSPNDIESIEVLKDASAAIYGVNAGNGVILITTKKGKEGKINISYNGSRTFSRNMKYLEPLNAMDEMSLFNSLSKDIYLATNDMQPFGPNTPAGFTPSFSDQDINDATNTDWVGHILRTGYIDNHNININGGTEKVSYYFSGGLYNQQGTIENSGLKKYNGMFDLTFKPSKYFTINASAIGTRSKFDNSIAGWQTGGAGGDGYTALQAALAYPNYLPIMDPATDNYTEFGMIGNPVNQLNIKDKTQNSTIMAKISLDINFIPEVLTGKILYGNNYEESLRDFYIPSNVKWYNIFLSRASIQQTSRQNQTFESYLTFNKKFGEIKVNVVAGYGEYINSGYSYGVKSTGMLDAMGTDRINGSQTDGNSSKYKSKMRSYFTRGTFDFYNKYLITAAYRYDGVDQFYPDNKYAGFPSVSVGWKISNEQFMSNLTMLDLLKLRASYGTTGSNLPGAAAYGLYSSGGDLVPFDNGGTKYVPYLLTSLNSPDLTWQKTIMKNVGLDFELFNSRISGSIEWFRDDVTNMLRWVNTPSLSFISLVPVNGGHQMRSGIDFQLEGDILRGKDYNWNLAINLSHYKYNWVERFKEDDRSTYLNVDDPVRAMYAFETNGILQPGQAIPAYQPSAPAAQIAGAPLFVDQNGDNVLDSADVIVYDQTPKVSIGLINTFKYKNFDLTISLYGQFGAYKQNYSLNWANAKNFVTASSGGATNGTNDLFDAWSSDNLGGTLPGSNYDETALGNIGNTIGWGSNYTITKANFVRARNITLGYTISTAKTKRYFQSVRVYFDVQNAFIITKFKGADPEIETPTVKGGAAPYPMVRNYSIGLNVNF